jgi:hypothetical protein
VPGVRTGKWELIRDSCGSSDRQFAPGAFRQQGDHKLVRVIIFEYNRDDIPAKKLPEGFYNPLHTQSYREIGKREEIYER